jgi:tetratricopeptide (TPR) repeat protein
MERTADHIAEDEVRRLMDGSLPAVERRRIVRHLLAGCMPCAGMARDVIAPEDPDYEGLVRRLELAMVLAENDVAVERSNALEGWKSLKSLRPERRLFLIRNDRGLQTWGMFEKILEEAKRIVRNDPLQSVDLASLALALTELLDADAYGIERIKDFQAGAQVNLANAKRIVSDFRGARQALQAAAGLLKEGTGDPTERINWLFIDASIKTDLGYFEEAEKVLQKATKLVRTVKDCHLEGRIAIQLSNFLGFLDPVAGLRLAEEGLALIDKDREPALELTGRHLTAFWANELGQPEEAEAILSTYAYLYKRFTDVFWRGRVLNLRANIARTENDFLRAEGLFRDLVDLYQEHGFEFDLALAALDLAEVLTILGRCQEAEEILSAVYPILQTWNIHVDILRTWLLLRENVQAGQAAREAFRELAMTLRRKWHRREEDR